MLASEDEAFSHKINKSQAKRYFVKKKKTWPESLLEECDSRTRDCILFHTSRMRNEGPLDSNDVPMSTLCIKKAKMSCVSAEPDLGANCRGVGTS